MREPGTFGLLALAYSQLLQGQLAQAADTYERIGKIDAQGASYRATGLGDLALYQGRLSDAAQTFSEGAAADLAAKDFDLAANKFAALAHTQAWRRKNSAAIAAAEQAIAHGKSMKIRFLAARVFVEVGAIERAAALAADLVTEVRTASQAYGKIIEAEAALKSGDPRLAIKKLTDSNLLLDTWIGHFDLGRAYLEAGAFTQADAEFERCLKRRGEALAWFDDEPTYGYFPPVYYYQGRVREGLNNAGFAESYRAYLDVRGKSGEDPLVSDIRRRTSR
jgi:tetratricopeptide (TPR) repeat protein